MFNQRRRYFARWFRVVATFSAGSICPRIWPVRSGGIGRYANFLITATNSSRGQHCYGPIASFASESTFPSSSICTGRTRIYFAYYSGIFLIDKQGFYISAESSETSRSTISGIATTISWSPILCAPEFETYSAPVANFVKVFMSIPCKFATGADGPTWRPQIVTIGCPLPPIPAVTSNLSIST